MLTRYGRMTQFSLVARTFIGVCKRREQTTSFATTFVFCREYPEKYLLLNVAVLFVDVTFDTIRDKILLMEQAKLEKKTWQKTACKVHRHRSILMTRFYFSHFLLSVANAESWIFGHHWTLPARKAYTTICQCTDIIIADTLSEDLWWLWIVDCLNLLFVHVARLMNNSCLPELSHQRNRKRYTTHTLTFNFRGVHKSLKRKYYIYRRVRQKKANLIHLTPKVVRIGRTI